MPVEPMVSVHLLPTLVPQGALRGGVAVVVDVLRATTTMVHALAAGCEAVIPCGEIDEARRVAAALPSGSALLGGERDGLPIEGFDLGNSPRSCTPEICQGKTLVMTTTNGTRAILACLEADQVIVTGFVNFSATIEHLAANLLKVHVRPIHIVCAGTDGEVSYEDTLLAGALAAGMAKRLVAPGVLANDAACLAESAWHRSFDKGGPVLAEALKRGHGGRNVLAIGMEDDIMDAARLDRFDLVALLRRDPLGIVTADEPAGA